MKFSPTVAFLAVIIVSPAGARAEALKGAPGRLCLGTYADDFSALSPQAREFDAHPEGAFSYCTRNRAVYECLSYGADGALKRSRKKAVLHGTAFAYKRQGGDVLLLTNDHVASWPAVTDAQHPVDDVPPGCKKISETLTLVDDEHDSYARDDVAVTRVVTDPQLDVAILKAHADLHLMPWKVGHSNALRERNLVEVRGFPLGAFRATNLGKVISTRDHDEFGDWDHDDFVVDALLSAGNSGSPVLALSCTTGEYELVGIFHAGYTEGSALNVVVGIDQVRDLMNTLKRSPRSRDDSISLDRAARTAIQGGLSADNQLFFPIGSQVGLVRGAPDGRLTFSVFPKDFPMSSEPALVLEDLPAKVPTAFGELGRVWFGSPWGLKAYDRSTLDADAATQATQLLDALRSDAARFLTYRTAREQETTSRQVDDHTNRLAADLARVGASRADLLQTMAELGERLAPQPGETGILLSATTPPASGPSPPAGTAAAPVGVPKAP